MNVYLKKKNNSWQKMVVGIAGLAVMIGALTLLQSSIKNTAYTVSAPFLKGFGNAGNYTAGLVGGVFSRDAVSQENSNLKQENQNLLSQIANLQQEVKQNQAITQVVKNTAEDNFKLTLAQVINLDGANDFVLINKGSEDGISENMPVISSTKVLLGKITNMHKNFSQVMLISNKNSVVDANILGEADAIVIPGVIKGSGSLLAYLDLVSSSQTLNENDTLITSGLEGIFPKNLLIGKITSIDKNDAKPFQTATIQPFFSTQNLDTFFIITNYLPAPAGKK